jgi:hypothetical protein
LRRALNHEKAFFLLDGLVNAVFNQSAANAPSAHITSHFQNARMNKSTKLKSYRHSALAIYVNSQSAISMAIFYDRPIAQKVVRNAVGFLMDQPRMDRF